MVCMYSTCMQDNIVTNLQYVLVQSCLLLHWMKEPNQSKHVQSPNCSSIAHTVSIESPVALAGVYLTIQFNNGVQYFFYFLRRKVGGIQSNIGYQIMKIIPKIHHLIFRSQPHLSARIEHTTTVHKAGLTIRIQYVNMGGKKAENCILHNRSHTS